MGAAMHSNLLLGKASEKWKAKPSEQNCELEKQRQMWIPMVSAAAAVWVKQHANRQVVCGVSCMDLGESQTAYFPLAKIVEKERQKRQIWES